MCDPSQDMSEGERRHSSAFRKKKNGLWKWRPHILVVRECIWCGRKDNLSEHHFVALAKGGMDVKENRMLLCVEHHRMIHRKPKR